MNEIKDRKKRADEFLKYLRDILIQNPNYMFQDNAVYHELIYLGVDKDDKNVRLDKENFGYWMDRNRDNARLNCFVDKDWSYFCQFVSKNVPSARNHLKTYIPLDAAHVRLGSDMIFDFLSKNNIPHLSKIGSHVRFDDVVVRLFREEDVKKLLEFVKNNKYIQSGLIKANPFLYSENGMPMTCDGRLSCNSTLATFIQDYMGKKKKEGKLKKVSIDDFYSYLRNMYNMYFSNARVNGSIAELFPDALNDLGVQSDIKGIMEILLNNINPNYTIEDYFASYHKMNNPQANIENRNIKLSIQLSNEEVHALIVKGLELLTSRFNSKETAINNLEAYVNNGSLQYITSREGLREKYKELNFDAVMREYLQRRGMSIRDYIATYIDKKEVKSEKYENVSDVSSKLRVLISVMASKYGFEQALINISEFLKTGKETYITREYNMREIIANSNFREKINKYIDANNLTVDEFMARMNKKTANDYLDDAITMTYIKYNSLDFVKGSLRELLKIGTYNGFTRDNGARDNLIDFVPVNIARHIVAQRFNISVEQLMDPEAIDAMCESYVASLVTKKL